MPSSRSRPARGCSSPTRTRRGSGPRTRTRTGWSRQYFPKGTDLSRWPAEDLEAVALAINNRPRKILGWKTPAEVFEEQLRSLQQPGVATTGWTCPIYVDSLYPAAGRYRR